MRILELGGGDSQEIKRNYSATATPKHRVTYTEKQKQQLKTAGNFAWKLLHNYKGCDPQWVELWEHFIPSSGGCGCKENYKAILADHPFDYSSPDAFFVSGVAVHNAVNQKLINEGDESKKILSIEEAREIWGRPLEG